MSLLIVGAFEPDIILHRYDIMGIIVHENRLL